MFFFQSYSTLTRWAKRDAFSFDDIQLSNISTTSSNESQSSNDHIWETYRISSFAECETSNCNLFTDNSNQIIGYQTSVKTTQAAEEHVQQSNNLSEYSITLANYMKHSIASTIVSHPEIENNKKMINYSIYNIESDSDNTDENELHNIKVSSELICSNSRMIVDCCVKFCQYIYRE